MRGKIVYFLMCWWMKYHWNRYNSAKSTCGFTLIELMAVVGIIAVLLTITGRAIFIVKQNCDLNIAANQIEATLKDCQASALYSGNWYKVYFWPSINRYRVYRGADEVVKDVQLENINLHYTNFSDNRVEFYHTGVPSMGGTVTLKNKNGKTLYVIMTPVTARTRISTEPPDNW